MINIIYYHAYIHPYIFKYIIRIVIYLFFILPNKKNVVSIEKFNSKFHYLTYLYIRTYIRICTYMPLMTNSITTGIQSVYKFQVFQQIDFYLTCRITINGWLCMRKKRKIVTYVALKTFV